MLPIIRELTGGELSEEMMQRICSAIPDEQYTYECGMGRTPLDSSRVLNELREFFPAFTFRIIVCHDRERTYFAITTKSPDPRELSEMSKHGYWDTDGDYHCHFDEHL